MTSREKSFTISKAGRPSSKSRHRKNYVEESAFQNVDLQMQRFKLFFNDPLHEKSFRTHSYLKSRTVVKICLAGLIAITALSFVFDQLIFGYDRQTYLLRGIVRGVIQIPVCICWFSVVAFRKERDRKNINAKLNAIDMWYEQRRRCFLLKLEYWKLGSLSASITSVCILAQTVISMEPDHGIYMLYSFMIYLFAGLPFFFSFLITWMTYLIFLISMYGLLSEEGYLVSANGIANDSFQLSAIYLFLTNILLTIAAYSLERGERIEFIHGMELNHQQTIIEGLLKELLPVHVTDKLRNVSNNDYMIAEQVQECTILFSDMVSFTKWASTQDADVLIQRLHELYACFDDLCLLHRVYKVETIGDAYFVSSNCPIMAPDHADRCLMLGKHMMIECRKLDWAGYSPRMRIGIHTGPVMAGVVGRKMPRYHLFGGTVLIAEELESSGKPDYLHISQYTMNHLISTEEWKIQCIGPKEVLHGSKVFNTYLVDLTQYLHDDDDEDEDKNNKNHNK